MFVPKQSLIRGTIPGAKSMPVDSIRERKSELTNKNLLVTCQVDNVTHSFLAQVGQRGHTASLLLKELGGNHI